MKAARWGRAAAIAVVAAAAMAGTPALADEAPPSPAKASVIASFEGGSIRLADGWGEAQACTYDGVDARCYRSEAEMDVAEQPEPGLAMARAECSLPTLKLYRGAGYGANVLQLTGRGVYHDLWVLGFDNDTESYKIGPCNARFYDVWPNTTLYSTSLTSAGTWAPSMSSGWDNRVSSVYIT